MKAVAVSFLLAFGAVLPALAETRDAEAEKARAQEAKANGASDATLSAVDLNSRSANRLRQKTIVKEEGP